MYTVLIPDAGRSGGINLARSLAMAPEPVRTIGLESHIHSLSFAETDCTYLAPADADADYIDFLRDVCLSQSVDVVIPVKTGHGLTRISANRALLPARLLLPRHEILALADDKWRSYLQLKESDIPVPETFLVQTPAQLETIFHTIGGKVWLRAIHGSGGKGALCTGTVDLAREWIEHWDGWGHFTAARFSGSAMVTWLSLWDNGEMLAGQLRERLYWEYADLSPSGVTGYTGAQRTIVRPDLVHLAMRAIQSVDGLPQGPYGVDILLDEQGVARVTEVQGGRFFVSTHFLAQCGLNLPYLALLAAMNDPRLKDHLPPADRTSPIPEGRIWAKYNETYPVLYDDAGVRRIHDTLERYRAERMTVPIPASGVAEKPVHHPEKNGRNPAPMMHDNGRHKAPPLNGRGNGSNGHREAGTPLSYWPPLEYGGDMEQCVRLHLNENLFVPDSGSALYAGDGRHGILVDELSASLQISGDRILLGPGSSSLLSACLLALGRDRAIVLPKPGWGYYSYLASLVTNRWQTYTLEPPDFTIRWERIAVLAGSPSLIVITLPHMPTGASMSMSDIAALAGCCSESIILLDEAYRGFSPGEPIHRLLDRYPNIITTRTFSKLYGLANSRIGYSLASPDHIDRFGPAVSLLGVSEASQQMAVAALRREEFYRELGREIALLRDWVRGELLKLGFHAPISSGNYLLVDVGGTMAAMLVRACREHGLIVRSCGSYGLPGHIRITIGPRDVMNRLLEIVSRHACLAASASSEIAVPGLQAR